MIKKIAHFSDTCSKHHLLTKNEIPKCDILIFSGNCTNNGYYHQLTDFLDWFKKQPSEYKILIGGERDTCLYNNYSPVANAIADFESFNNFYLNNELVNVDGVDIYGTSFSRYINSNIDTAFAFYDDKLTIDNYNKIPDFIDVLVTSTPPFSILDKRNKFNVGDYFLNQRISNLKKLKLHCFGRTYCNGIHDTFDVRYSNGNVLAGVNDLGFSPHVFEIEV